MKKILFILLALSFTLTSCKKDDDPQECFCTVFALDENDEQYTISNYPMDCETRQATRDDNLIPTNHAFGGCN